MLQTVTAVPVANPIAAANRASREGDYVQARALLETTDMAADDTAAMLYIMILDKMDAQADKQAAVARLIKPMTPTSARSDTFLTYFMRQAQRACLPHWPVARVLAAAAARDTSQGELGMVFDAVKARQTFRRRQAPRAARARFISLGTSCLPWTLLNRWGLRDATSFVEDYNPFCLATHKMAGLIEALESDFANYAAADEITVEQYKRGNPVARRRDHTVTWNHNQGVYWTRDDCRALIVNLQQKVENFRSSCQAELPVFILTAPLRQDREGAAMLARLQQALARMTGRERNYLILTNQATDAPASSPRRLDETTFAFHCPYPDADYMWFELNVADSPVGLKYERSYVKFLFACLNRWGLLDPPLARPASVDGSVSVDDGDAG